MYIYMYMYIVYLYIYILMYIVYLYTLYICESVLICKLTARRSFPRRFAIFAGRTCSQFLSGFSSPVRCVESQREHPSTSSELPSTRLHGYVGLPEGNRSDTGNNSIIYIFHQYQYIIYIFHG